MLSNQNKSIYDMNFAGSPSGGGGGTGGMGAMIGSALGGPIGGIAGSLFDSGGAIPGMGGSTPDTDIAESRAYSNSSFAPISYVASGISSTVLIVFGVAAIVIFGLFGSMKKRR